MSQVAVSKPEMNLAVLVKRACQDPEQMKDAQTEAFAGLFKGTVLKQLGRSLLNISPLGPLVAEAVRYHIPCTGSRVSREYSRGEIAQILADNGVYDSREVALGEMNNVLSRTFTDSSGAEVYSWEKVENPQTSQQRYYLTFDFYGGD